MRGQCWMPCDMDSGWWNFRILNFNVLFQIFEFSNVFLFFRIFEFLNFRVVFQIFWIFEFSNFWISIFRIFEFLNFRVFFSIFWIFEFSNFRGNPCRTHGIGTSQKKMPQYLYNYNRYNHCIWFSLLFLCCALKSVSHSQQAMWRWRVFMNIWVDSRVTPPEGSRTPLTEKWHWKLLRSQKITEQPESRSKYNIP